MTHRYIHYLALIVLAMPFVFADPCQYISVNDTLSYSCTIPVSLSVSTPEFIELEQEHIIASAQQEIQLNFSLYNNADSTDTFSYYAYAYLGARCVSCIESREETTQKVSIAGKTQEQYTISITIPETGNFSYKVFAKRGDARWQERRGTLEIQSARPQYNPEFHTAQAARKKYIGFGLALGAISLAIAGVFKKKKSTNF